MNFKDLSNQYYSGLLENIIPFWEQHSIDQDGGGYFTCLMRNGQIFDTDKFIWLQARQVWMFAKIYTEIQPKTRWLNIAEHGAQFLYKHGRDHQGYWYFSLNQIGQPLTHAYNIFSDCFACMAFAQLYRVTENITYKDVATSAFQNILKRKSNPKGPFNKRTDIRQLKSLALPMIMINLIMELDGLIETDTRNQILHQCISDVLNDFVHDGLLMESVNLNGTLSNSMEGRLVNPGHGLEAMWFLLDVPEVRQDQKKVDQIIAIILNLLDYGWDTGYGGFYYFKDINDFPLQQLEFDQKLWWVHLEAMIACLKAYQVSKNHDVLDWFKKIHTYSWAHFADSEYGEWFGYLHRDGSRLNQLKGGKWKGCFHVPRAFLIISRMLNNLS